MLTTSLRKDNIKRFVETAFEVGISPQACVKGVSAFGLKKCWSLVERLKKQKRKANDIMFFNFLKHKRIDEVGDILRRSVAVWD